MIDWILVPSWILAYILFFVIGEVLYRVFRVSTIHCRIVVHVLVGFLIVFHPISMRMFPYMEICTLGTLPVFYHFERSGFMPSIFGDKVRTWGTYLYPISVYILFRLWEFENDSYMYYFVPTWAFTVGDMSAAVIGRHIPWRPYKLFGQEKTFSGCIAFFVMTFVGVMGIFIYYFPYVSLPVLMIAALVFSLIMMLIEGVSMHGWDNFTVPILGFGVLWIVEHFIIQQF